MSWLKNAVKKAKKAGRAVDLSAKHSAVRGGLRKLDNAVGGAKGWAKVAGAGAAVAAVVPGVGTAVAAGLGGVAAVTAAAAKKQAAGKAAREEAAALAAPVAQTGDVLPDGTPATGSSSGTARPLAARPLTFLGWLRSLLGGQR